MIENRVTLAARPWPLGVLLRLRPVVREIFRPREAFLTRLGRHKTRRAVGRRYIIRLAMSRPVDHINRVARPQKMIAPSRPAIRRAEKIRSGLTAAMNQHDRIRPARFFGNLI